MVTDSSVNPVTVTDATIATFVDNAPGDYGLIADGAVVIEGDRVAWVGPRSQLPAEWARTPSWSAAGKLVTPGLVECHSHLIFGGDRRDEFAERAAGGVSYIDQVQSGAGILATVKATRSATEDQLFAGAYRRALWFVNQGVTTLEVKSGYGLDPESELAMLRVGRRLGESLPIRVRNTLLAGHVYPPDIDREDYVVAVCTETIPNAHAAGILDSVEVYCDETIGLSLDDASTVLEAAYRKKIPTRLQTDHFSDCGGAALAPAFYARAAAHLAYSDDIAVKAMASAGTTAVLLPGAHLELRATQYPPVKLLREAGVAMAVSTGCNPGSSPIASPLVAAHLSCVLFGLSPREALAGITAASAKALELSDNTGTIVRGGPADLAVWEADHPEELVYWLGAPLCSAVWSHGQLFKTRPLTAHAAPA